MREVLSTETWASPHRPDLQHRRGPWHDLRFQRNDADRLVSVTDAQTPTPGVTRYTYDTESHVTDIYDAKNNHTNFYYSSGALRMTTFPSGDYELYSFSNNQKLLFGMTDRNGNYHSYQYDPQDRLYQWAGYLTASYDGAGRLSQITDGLN